ncbi:hypothetical protein [Streptomyces sp. NPDC048411]|uniref:hypothetical protein n=1 Tax=Streptomyces sp. NPDC048411 TaxID=3157206 RepID=UPI0034539B87
MTEVGTVEPPEAVPSKSVDDQLIDELVGHAQGRTRHPDTPRGPAPQRDAVS